MRYLILAAIVAAPLVIATAGPGHAKASTTYDFEACEQGWKIESSSSEPHPLSSWHLGPPGNASAQAFHVNLYGGDASESLSSPAHAWKGGTVTVGFAIRYQFEPEETSLGADNIGIEWSRNGSLWTPVENYKPLAPAFETHEVSFKAPKGKVYIRFHLVSDQLVSGTGASVDDVTINAATPKEAAC